MPSNVSARATVPGRGSKRKFNKKIFSYVGFMQTKASAEKFARELRARGSMVRLTKGVSEYKYGGKRVNGYRIWERKR